MLLKVSEGRCDEEGKRVSLVIPCLDSAGLNDVDGAGVGDDGRDDGTGEREDGSLGLNNGWEGYGLAGSESAWLEALYDASVGRRASRIGCPAGASTRCDESRRLSFGEVESASASKGMSSGMSGNRSTKETNCPASVG